MEPENALYARNRHEWREWLEENHGTKKEVSLVSEAVREGIEV